MAEIICKGCGASDDVKNGYVRGLQRYRCKECGCNFTATAPGGKPAAMKALALLLYAMANVSFCAIARLLKVSDVAVLKWVRAEARTLPEPEPSGHIAIVTLDEMWHFLSWSLALLGRSSSGGHQLCQTLLQGPGIFGGSCACAPSWIIVPP